MKSKIVIGFRPDEKQAEVFQQAVDLLNVSPSELAREIFLVGLEPALEMLQKRNFALAVRRLRPR